MYVIHRGGLGPQPSNTTSRRRKNAERCPFSRKRRVPGNANGLQWAFFSVEGGDWCFPIYRGDDRGPFTSEDARLLAGVGPYVAKLVGLAQKLAAFDTASKLSALERVSSAAIVLDGTGRAAQMNLPAQNLLARTSTLSEADQRPATLPAIADCSN